MSKQHEHEFEAQYGLPERLPAGERLLWQGAPAWRELARRAFHLDKLALYFGVILALRATVVVADGGNLATALHAVVVLAPLFAIGLGLAAMFFADDVIDLAAKKRVCSSQLAVFALVRRTGRDHSTQLCADIGDAHAASRVWARAFTKRIRCSSWR